MQKKINNYAFIDSQNVYQGTKRDLGWSIDWGRFRTYLRDKYRVTKAFLFIGFIPEHNDIYNDLQQAGFILIFKPVLSNGKDGVKGNVDADMVLQAMIEYDNYNKAVLVTSDGDFYSLTRHLYDKQKLEVVLSPQKHRCSTLLRKSAKEKMRYLDALEKRIARRKGTV